MTPPRNDPERPLSARSTMRRALPALLALWGVTLLAIAVLDWARYRVFLELWMVAR